jgi:tetrapyrrole methylase family protein/MazG family protein
MKVYGSNTADWSQVFCSFGIDLMSGALQIVPASCLQAFPALPKASRTDLGEGGPPSEALLYLSRPMDVQLSVIVVNNRDEEGSYALEVLRQYYSTGHAVTIIDAEGLTHSLALGDVIGFQYMYLPPAQPLEVPDSFDTLRYLVARLRGPGGCPWDREQTHSSLKPFLIEETYEALESLDEKDSQKLCEELGDLLLQILLHSQLAHESGHFTINDVVESISLKLIRRHPHVFGQVLVTGSQEVLQNWDDIKRNEGKGRSLLEGVPKGMPALAYAQSIQKRAARTGFDWPSIEGALDKVAEELQEIKEIGANQASEFGDLLFALVNVARWMDIDAEESLRLASRRFYQRFLYIEAHCARHSVAMSSLSLSQLDGLWEEAKLQE